MPYPKTSPSLKGAFSRLLEAGSGGPALGQWWLRWRGAGGAGTHSILNLLPELGRPRGEPESQIWGMPWRDGWAWGLGGQGETLAHPKTPSCLCSHANASRRFDAPQVCHLSPTFHSTPPSSQTTPALTHTFPPALMHSLLFPQSLPLSDLSSFFPHCVGFIWCQHIKVPNHQSERFLLGAIYSTIPYAREATPNQITQGITPNFHWPGSYLFTIKYFNNCTNLNLCAIPVNSPKQVNLGKTQSWKNT